MAVTLDATVSGNAANSYLTVAEADDLFEGFDLKVMDKWDDLESDKQCQLLIQATRRVDQYKSWGPRKVEGQRLAFPRSTDKEAIIPEPVRLAVMEYLVYIIEDVLTSLKRLQAEGVTSASILGQSSSFSAEPSEMPSGARRELDKLVRAHFPKGFVNRDVRGISAGGFKDPESFFG